MSAETGRVFGARRPFLRSETVNLTRSAVNQPRYRQAADEKKKRKGKKENPMVSAGQAKFLPGIAVPSIVIRERTVSRCVIRRSCSGDVCRAPIGSVY
ncbi:uncharacterized protein LOC105428347 isoform X5 [Pogonomyrmex barbatus]|uniref:Uncharacterized protein LOC105428347 isoform X5 n=1 Tax=Pogonomyrmex barbatus TaxID=144034 RepID=A0A6I9WAB7_9HYME|nr:uncharacterized protein LOC105428347 isoform X5 [Pogonomyrmex barbatus]